MYPTIESIQIFALAYMLAFGGGPYPANTTVSRYLYTVEGTACSPAIVVRITDPNYDWCPRNGWTGVVLSLWALNVGMVQPTAFSTSADIERYRQARQATIARVAYILGHENYHLNDTHVGTNPYDFWNEREATLAGCRVSWVPVTCPPELQGD